MLLSLSFCRILYTLIIESYYSCMRGMRNNAVKESKEWENIVK